MSDQGVMPLTLSKARVRARAPLGQCALVMGALLSCLFAASCEREKPSSPAAADEGEGRFQAYQADLGGVADEDHAPDLEASYEIREPLPVGIQRYTVVMGEDHILLMSEDGGLVNLFPTLLVVQEGQLPREVSFGVPSLSTREGGFWSIHTEAKVGEATYEWVVRGGPAAYELVTELIERTISGKPGPAVTLRLKGLSSIERLVMRVASWRRVERGVQTIAARFSAKGGHASVRSSSVRFLSVGPRSVELTLRPRGCKALIEQSEWRLRWRLGQRPLPTASVPSDVCSRPVNFELLESGHVIAALPERGASSSYTLRLPPAVRRVSVDGEDVDVIFPTGKEPLPQIALDLEENARRVLDLRAEDDSRVFEPTPVELLLRVVGEDD